MDTVRVMRNLNRHWKAILVAALALFVGFVVVEMISKDSGAIRRGFRNGYEPGETEVFGPLTIRHLQDGVFVSEQATNGYHHFLIQGPMSRFALTPAGLELMLIEKKKGFLITKREAIALSTKRQPGDWVVGFLDATRPKPEEASDSAVVDGGDSEGQAVLDAAGFGLLSELDSDRGSTRFHYNESVQAAVENFTAETTVWDIYSSRL